VGGISEPKELFELWSEGGKAAQVYTAYVYQGPDLLKKFNKAISNFIKIQNTTLEDFFLLSLDERRYRLKDFI
jgi:dihydroorotate dehydrogenase